MGKNYQNPNLQPSKLVKVELIDFKIQQNRFHVKSDFQKIIIRACVNPRKIQNLRILLKAAVVKQRVFFSKLCINFYSLTSFQKHPYTINVLLIRGAILHNFAVKPVDLGNLQKIH